MSTPVIRRSEYLTQQDSDAFNIINVHPISRGKSWLIIRFIRKCCVTLSRAAATGASACDWNMQHKDSEMAKLWQIFLLAAAIAYENMLQNISPAKADTRHLFEQGKLTNELTNEQH